MKSLFENLTFYSAAKNRTSDLCFACIGIDDPKSKAHGIHFVYFHNRKISALDFLSENYLKVDDADQYRVRKLKISYAEKPDNEFDYMYSILCRDRDVVGLAAMGQEAPFVVGCFSQEDAQKLIDADLFSFQCPVETVCIKVEEMAN